MTDDLLERAVAVARNRYDGSSANAAQTERRMLLALQARERRRSRAPLLALPLVAALLASAAWGSVSESTRASVRSALHGLLPAHVASAPSKRVHTRTAPPSAAPARLPLSSVASAPSAPSTADAPPAAPISPPSRHASSQLSARLPAVEPPPRPALGPVPPAASEAEISALYRAAHHAQFSGGDPAFTLTLWDRYLAAAANGSLSPEARYNRAITLLRLGRNSEAASALEPFARGDYGAYRQSEANALLNSVRHPAPPP
jgi:hypothetical protein